MKATFERVGLDLWGKVQQISDQRFAGRYTKAKRDFAFSGLISCGHCGCSLVGELKKGRHVYYHCTGYKGKCPESYTREEVLEKLFADLLKDLVFDDEVLDWVAEAMRQSHEDEKRFQDEAISHLQA
ncbi:MAG TPA: zinc ribbon domain-containing protein [Pyrinomonadaceae bacterium]|nr:zinc ribbon domain-containing protein [Pyrinomonadaceae bacterium]